MKSEAIALLNQIIEEAQRQDLEFKQKMVREHQAEKSIGESWLVFHLKTLKELLTTP